MPGEIEVLRELYLIVARRDGAILRTRYVEDRWIEPDEPAPKDHIYVCKSTRFEGETVRRRSAG